MVVVKGTAVGGYVVVVVLFGRVDGWVSEGWPLLQPPSAITARVSATPADKPRPCRVVAQEAINCRFMALRSADSNASPGHTRAPTGDAQMVTRDSTRGPIPAKRADSAGDRP